MSVQSAEQGSGRRIPELDGLRGMAILLVFMAHYLGGAGHIYLKPSIRHVLAIANLGWSGVDLFFVLSGFLIGGILLQVRHSEHYFKAFYMRRIFRILPVYYLWIVLYAAIVALGVAGGPNPFSLKARDFLQIPYQLLFLQNFQFNLYPFQMTWFLVTWSLAVEEQFYLFAPLLIRLLPDRKLIVFLISAILAAPFLRFMAFRYWFPGSMAPVYLLPCRADALAMGVLLAVGWRSQSFHRFLHESRRLVQGVALVLIGGICASIRFMVGEPSLLRVVVGLSWLPALYACLLILALSQSDGWVASIFRWNLLRSLGTISYCVYIIHLTLLLVAHRLILGAGPEFYNLKGAAVTAGAAAASILLAMVSWRYYEKPLIKHGHAYRYAGSAEGKTHGAEVQANTRPPSTKTRNC